MVASLSYGPIYNTQSNKIRTWVITINLYNDKHVIVPITSVDMDVDEGWTCEYFTETGCLGMKITTSEVTIVSSGKNLGKKNETNVLTQASNECMSKYRLKIKGGYTEDMPTLETKVEQATTKTKEDIPFPMAVDQWKNHKHKLKFPLFVQPKLNGIRLLTYLDSKGNVQFKTRRLHEIHGFETLKKELTALYEKSSDKSLIIDGELYKHKTALQDINGVASRISLEDEEKNNLQYWVFDCFDINNPKEPFSERFEKLKHFIGKESASIIINETIEVFNEEEATKYFDKMREDEFEGIIYKPKDKPYEFAWNKEKRSLHYLKRKHLQDDEFEIIGFTQGKGKDLGCVIFKLKTKDGKEFNSAPNGTYESKKETYKQCVKDFSQFKGKLAKVEFVEYSKTGVPQHNHMIMIRDLNFD